MTINMKIQNTARGGCKGCSPALFQVKLPCCRAGRQKEHNDVDWRMEKLQEEGD